MAPINSYIKYSGLAFQMMAVMGAGVWAGLKLDAWLGLKFPAFLVILSLLSTIASIIVLIKSLPKE